MGGRKLRQKIFKTSVKFLTCFQTPPSPWVYLQSTYIPFPFPGAGSPPPDSEGDADEMTANNTADSTGGQRQGDSDRDSERSAASPPAAGMSPPRIAESPVQLIKMKDQAELLMAVNSGADGGGSPLDQLLLKGAVSSSGGGSPFLLPAQFLALNPGL